jgi:hypothetical protein
VAVVAPTAGVAAARVTVAAVVATLEALAGAAEAPAAVVAARVAAAVGAIDGAEEGAVDGAVDGAVVAAPPPQAASSASTATRLAVVRKTLRLKRITSSSRLPTEQRQLAHTNPIPTIEYAINFRCAINFIRLGQQKNHSR